MTNYEKIKNMSVEEMAKYFDEKLKYCDSCWLSDKLCRKHYKEDRCDMAWLEWLNQEVEE